MKSILKRHFIQKFNYHPPPELILGFDGGLGFYFRNDGGYSSINFTRFKCGCGKFAAYDSKKTLQVIEFVFDGDDDLKYYQFDWECDCGDDRSITFNVSNDGTVGNIYLDWDYNPFDSRVTTRWLDKKFLYNKLIASDNRYDIVIGLFSKLENLGGA
ncbi:MAG: hypothetical protein GWN01_03795 [Nitrosopumilaceae archaeon]|nr:hypothetical protein [Nitrosopumilaceae archaeon]NIU86463.1 hypothetical protein [Nitrosopumilaceae archaeon]NIV65229.1 hypothetical protein [Nitrosopumilaceae archaeon]NIX60681.1 hypothetical protein [Nitrosopumilaceae archaeon]